MDRLLCALRTRRRTQKAVPTKAPDPPTLLTLPPEIRNKIYEDVFDIFDYGTHGFNRTRAHDLLFPAYDPHSDNHHRVIIGRPEQLKIFNNRTDLCWLGRLDFGPLFTCKQMYRELRHYAYNIPGIGYVRIECLRYRDSEHKEGAILDRVGTVLWWPTTEPAYQVTLSTKRAYYHYLQGAEAAFDSHIAVSGVWQLADGLLTSLIILPDPVSAAPVSAAVTAVDSHYGRWDILTSWNQAAVYWSVQMKDMRSSPGGNLLLTKWAPRPELDTRLEAYTTVPIYAADRMIFNKRTREVIMCRTVWTILMSMMEGPVFQETEAYVGGVADVVPWLDRMVQIADVRRDRYFGPVPRMPRDAHDCLLDLLD